MKQSIIGIVTITIALIIFVGCSSKLDNDGVNSSLKRFVSEYKYVLKKTQNTGVLGYVGPVIVKENEATVDFTIKYHSDRFAAGTTQEEKAVATFSRTQEGKWILTRVKGNGWGGGGWWTESGELNWEVK